jgi:hypothetical protein
MTEKTGSIDLSQYDGVSPFSSQLAHPFAASKSRVRETTEQAEADMAQHREELISKAVADCLTFPEFVGCAELTTFVQTQSPPSSIASAVQMSGAKSRRLDTHEYRRTARRSTLNTRPWSRAALRVNNLARDRRAVPSRLIDEYQGSAVGVHGKRNHQYPRRTTAAGKRRASCTKKNPKPEYARLGARRLLLQR